MLTAYEMPMWDISNQLHQLITAPVTPCFISHSASKRNWRYSFQFASTFDLHQPCITLAREADGGPITVNVHEASWLYYGLMYFRCLRRQEGRWELDLAGLEHHSATLRPA